MWWFAIAGPSILPANDSTPSSTGQALAIQDTSATSVRRCCRCAIPSSIRQRKRETVAPIDATTELGATSATVVIR